MTFDALVLCGGGGTRLGGVDKGALVLGDRTLLDRAIEAVAAAHRTIVVGPKTETEGPVTWTSEDPPGGGPVAAIAAGLEHVTSDVVVILGVDHPFVDGACVLRILEALDDHPGAVVTDATGRHQFLVGAYRVAALLEALDGKQPHGMSVRSLLAGMSLVTLPDPRSALDIDTPGDLERAGEALARE